MKLIITVERIKDATKKTKQCMIVTFIDKDGSKTMAVNELPPESFLGQEFDAISAQMKDLKKQKAKLEKEKAKAASKITKSKTSKK